MSNDSAEKARWQREAEFFDRDAEIQLERIRRVDPFTLERYGRLRRPWFNKEYRFRVLGALEGKSVLDVGCGDGTNAVTFAKLGASVTGIDISPKSIELAKKRMAINGVDERVRFECAPLEVARFADSSFDIIWGDAILHHLIPELDDVLGRLMRWAKPGAVIMFAEPVSLSATMRRLRRAMPISTDATPDERPLEPAEIDILRSHLPDLRVRYFSTFERFNRFVLQDRYDYEASSRPRRAIASALALADYLLLSVPPLRVLAGTAVFHGHKPALPGQ